MILFYVEPHRLGHLDEAAQDLSVAEEMTEGDEAKANLCQKLVCSMLKHLKAYFSSQVGYFFKLFFVAGANLQVVW